MDLKIKDVAELLGVSETTIRRWLTEGKIPAYRLHHQYRFSRSEIENWMMSCKVDQEKSSFSPFKESQIYPKEKEEMGSGMNQFGLFRALHKGIVLSDVEGEDPESIIRTTMNLAAKDLPLDAEGVAELLLDRERLMPTALNHGIALPHTRDFLLKDQIDLVVVVYPKMAIDWKAMDQKKVHTLFFLFACSDKRHLHLLAKIAHLSSDPKALEFLKSRPKKPELLQFIKQWESNIREYE